MPQTFLPMFFWTVPVGAALFMAVWLPTRGLTHRSRLLRFLLSGIVAASLTPAPLEVCGQQYIFPAAYVVSLMLFAQDPVGRAIGMVWAVLPLVTITAIVFCLWSYYAERSRNVT
jgi:hypothetical protein